MFGHSFHATTSSCAIMARTPRNSSKQLCGQTTRHQNATSRAGSTKYKQEWKAKSTCSKLVDFKTTNYQLSRNEPWITKILKQFSIHIDHMNKNLKNRCVTTPGWHDPKTVPCGTHSLSNWCFNIYLATQALDNMKRLRTHSPN